MSASSVAPTPTPDRDPRPGGRAADRAEPETAREGPVRRTLRHLLFALILLTVGGLLAELFLLEHYEDWRQWTPLVALVLTAAFTVRVWSRPTGRSVLAFRGLMMLCLVIAVVGMWLHYDANAALELELASDIGGFDLVWRALHGGIPTLAPGAMIQLGLIGLIATWRHPALGRDPDTGDVPPQ